jgi:hypothetical protein
MREGRKESERKQKRKKKVLEEGDEERAYVDVRAQGLKNMANEGGGIRWSLLRRSSKCFA